MIVDPQAGTRITEISPSIYQIHTPVGGFSFNQYLLHGDEPILYHTGSRALMPLVARAIATVMPLAALRWIGYSHFESDECGAANLLLAAAPHSQVVSGRIGAMINADAFDRPPRALADGELLDAGAHRLRWFDTPHLPHGWECGHMFDEATQTLLCGDLFTQDGGDHLALVVTDVLEPSERARRGTDYYAHGPRTRPQLERLAATRPSTLACMHGSAFAGDGGALLLRLADALCAA